MKKGLPSALLLSSSLKAAGGFGQFLQQLVGQHPAAGLVQRRQLDVVLEAFGASSIDEPVAAPLEQRGPGEGQHQQWHIAVHFGQVVQEIQALVIGPVQVFELHDDRAAVGGAQAPEVLRRRMEGAVPELLRVVQDGTNVAAVAPFDADQVAQQVGVAFGEVRAIVVLEQRHDALLHLRPGNRDRVVVGDLETPGQDIAQQAEGLSARLRRGPAAKEEEALGSRFAPALEFVQQPALADAGVGHHRDGGQPALVEQSLEGGLKRSEFGLATDHAGGHAFDAAAGDAEVARFGPPHQVAVDRMIHALHHQGVLRVDLEQAAHLQIGVVADAQGPCGRGLLHPRGDVDGNATDAAVGVDPAAQQHAAGVQAHAHIEAGVAVGGEYFRAECLAQFEQGQTAAHGALGVVFARLVGAERGQDVVAGVLQDLAALRLDDGRAARQGVVHRGADGFGVEVLGKRGGAHRVQEQDGDLPEALGGRSRCWRGGQGAQPGACRCQQRFDDSIPQSRALAFKGRYRDFELLLFGRHRHAAYLRHGSRPPPVQWWLP